MLTIREQMEKDLAEANKTKPQPKVYKENKHWINDLFSRQPDPPRRSMSQLSYDIEREIISLRKGGMTYGQISERLNIHSTQIVDVIQGFNG